VSKKYIMEGVMLKIFAVRGIKKSGKTTTVSKIITELKNRGYKVGSIKYIHHEDFEMDKDPNTDTRKHRDAGANIVCARANHETSILFPEKLPLNKIYSVYDGIVDFVILEGVNEADVPAIITAHNKDDLIQKWTDNVFCISGRIANNIKEHNGFKVIDATTNVKELVDFIENFFISHFHA